MSISKAVADAAMTYVGDEKPGEFDDNFVTVLTDYEGSIVGVAFRSQLVEFDYEEAVQPALVRETYEVGSGLKLAGVVTYE